MATALWYINDIAAGLQAERIHARGHDFDAQPDADGVSARDDDEEAVVIGPELLDAVSIAATGEAGH